MDQHFGTDGLRVPQEQARLDQAHRAAEKIEITLDGYRRQRTLGLDAQPSLLYAGRVRAVFWGSLRWARRRVLVEKNARSGERESEAAHEANIASREEQFRRFGKDVVRP